jgi:HEAT repeat protein
VFRFIRLCQNSDNGEGELAVEGQEALARITTGGTLQLLLADLLAMPGRPDQDALELIRDIGVDGGSALVTFLRESDDLRARRVVAKLLEEIGGEPQSLALDSITHGENPVVARRVIGVLDYLSIDLINDLSRAVTVRNPGVLGEAIKVLQRQPRRIQIQVIGSLLESASPELVCRGVYYLREWNFEEAQGMLLMLLRESENHEILASVTAAVARWRLPEAIPILGELLGRKQVMRVVPIFPRGLRREFARALAAIGTPEAQGQLAEFTKDMDPEVRNIARGMPAPTGA